MHKFEEDGEGRRVTHKPPVFTKCWSSNRGYVITDNTAIYLVIALGLTFCEMLSMGYIRYFNSLTESMK